VDYKEGNRRLSGKRNFTVDPIEAAARKTSEEDIRTAGERGKKVSFSRKRKGVNQNGPCQKKKRKTLPNDPKKGAWLGEKKKKERKRSSDRLVRKKGGVCRSSGGRTRL